MCQPIGLIFCLLCFLLSSRTLPAADRIELETGEVLVGKILRVTKSEVSIQISGGGVLSFRLANVRRIRKYPGKGEETEESVLIYEKPGLQEKKDEKAEKEKVETADPASPIPKAPPPAEKKASSPPSQRRPDQPENTVTDKKNGFAVAPPKGLVVWPESQSETVPLAFQDPFSRASFTVSMYPSTGSIEEFKNAALRSYTGQFKVFRVLREERLKQDAKEVEPEAWIVEIETRLGSVTVHQVQIFTRNRTKAFILTYSVSGDNYPKYQDVFEKSLESFHLLEPTEKPAPSPPDAQAEQAQK